MGCEWGTDQCQKLMKVLIIIAALFLIGIGVVRFFNTDDFKFLQIVLSIYYM